MDDQQIFEIIDPTFFTLSTSDQVLACHTDQLTDCTNISKYPTILFNIKKSKSYLNNENNNFNLFTPPPHLVS